MITQSTKLNLIPGDVPKRITASQYDAGSRTLSFTLYNGAVAFTTAGVTAQIRGTKPDQKGFEYTATYNAGVVTCDVTEQMTACAGEVVCELQLSKDGEVLGTANFILDVERAALGEDTDISETELPDIIDGARTQAANAAESAEDAAESAAIAEQAASGVYLGINMGKVVTVTSGVADTDIDLERMPKPGERILLVFEEERTSVTNIKTYLDGAGITIPIGTGEPSQRYLGQYVFECASGTQPESRLWNMVTKDYGVLPTPFAISVGGTGNTSGYIRTGREGSSTVGTAATIEGTHNEAGYANQTVMGIYNNNKADTLLEVGNGSSSARSNALEVTATGHVKDGLGNDMESLSALEATASGNPIVVNAQDVAAKGLKVRIEPIQEGSGDPSPTNIRPISGRTEVNAGRTAHNVWDEQWRNGYYDLSTGAFVSLATAVASKNPTAVSVNTAYRFVTGDSNNVAFVFFYKANGDFISALRITGSGDFTTPADTAYIHFNYNASPYGDTYKNDTSINYPSTATAYEPYAGVTLTIALGQTVYGGTLDVKTGVLTITWVLVLFDGSNDENWVKASDAQGVYIPVNDMSKELDYTNKIKCNRLATYESNIAQDYLLQDSGITGYRDNSTTYPNENWIYAKVSGIDTATDFKTWLASNNLQVCYELATPTTIQLTPAQLELLKGYNYITGDGIIDLVYVPESISGLMEEVLVPISMLGTNESGNTKASRAYTSGEYFYQNGKMYKATTSIASGATFTVGTNCQQTTLFAELKAAQN